MRITRPSIMFAAGVILGAAAGFASAIFVYPYIFLADIVVSEALQGNPGTVAARGAFIHADPRDPIHYGSGSVTVYRDLVRLEEDFQVGPGPKYHVYLVPDRKVTPQTAVHKTAYVDLGRLRAFKGSQNFALPPGTDLARYGSVVIWCEQFGVLISPAELRVSAPH
jgi:hypothetical protein